MRLRLLNVCILCVYIYIIVFIYYIHTYNKLYTCMYKCRSNEWNQAPMEFTHPTKESGNQLLREWCSGFPSDQSGIPHRKSMSGWSICMFLAEKVSGSMTRSPGTSHGTTKQSSLEDNLPLGRGICFSKVYRLAAFSSCGTISQGSKVVRAVSYKHDI